MTNLFLIDAITIIAANKVQHSLQSYQIHSPPIDICNNDRLDGLQFYFNDGTDNNKTNLKLTRTTVKLKQTQSIHTHYKCTVNNNKINLTFDVPLLGDITTKDQLHL